MGTITTTDGTEIFYKDWGSGQPIVFSHGWPLSADDWDTQLLFFLQHGYRVIAHDRRGHGRSTQTGAGHDMDHYADDLAALTAHLELEDAVHVGHSTGGGEVVRYIARHGESRVAKAVLISAVPPLMVQTDANPGGLPKSVFDGFQAQLAARSGARCSCRCGPIVRARPRAPRRSPAEGRRPGNTMTSRGSSRSSTAPMASPSGRTAGMSLQLCTAKSTSPRSSASSISLTNRRLPPTSDSGASCSRSPLVLMTTISHGGPPACSTSAAAVRACHNAS